MKGKAAEAKKEDQEIYLDNSATTRCFDEVAELMAGIYTKDYGNPSSAHHKGVVAEQYIREAKERIAKILRCKPEELYFTSGGTESDNLAVIGAAHANKRSGMHIVSTQMEHPAVRRAMEHLEKEGYEVTYWPVDQDGIVEMNSLENIISGDTVLVSVMHTNNEIGSVQPITQIGQWLKRKYPKILFHVDAVQGFGKAVIHPREMGVDLLSISGHKIHGPKGIGLLYVSEKAKLEAQNYGGGQQNGLRSGTENVPGIAGMALAAELLEKDMTKELERLFELKKYFVQELQQIEGVRINGIPGMPKKESDADEAAKDEMLKTAVHASAPHIVSASFEGVRAEVLLHALEEKGIYVSAGSACATHKPEISETLKAIGLKKDLLDSTLRFSFSVFTTKKELEQTVSVLKELLPELRKFTQR
ncbi:MAG: cysteine desulfurase [Lachnospiraceae bacterium]|nr:cysteine desulfurase [Lachnospiraceae bacterium]